MSDDDLGKLFRELPDEDPPEGGMAALMAAATRKAREMAPAPKISLFARFVETFKRPPVLAFATIVLLIGGVVIVKRHGDPIEVAERAPASNIVASGSSVAPPAMSAPVTAVPEAPAPAGAATAPAAKPKPATTSLARDPTKPPPPPPPAAAVASQSVNGELAPAQPEPTRRAPPTASPRGMTIATDDDTTRTYVAKTPLPASAEQLLHECQSAANRGDCPAVRTIAGKIQTSNASFYRDRVVKDAVIAKCL